jgi:cholesterol transport system auxiliary component
MARRAYVLLALLVSTAGCALLTKADPVVPRYFTPEVAESEPATKNTDGAGLSVRIGRVGGSSYLKERMAYRDSEHEYGFYEDRRWTERPEVYLQRAVEHSLFEVRGLKRALSATSPTLTLDLTEFEEVRGAAPHVRLRLSYALHDERTVFRERSFAIERPLAAGSEAMQADRVAAALSDALQSAVTRIVDEVIAELAAERDGGT